MSCSATGSRSTTPSITSDLPHQISRPDSDFSVLNQIRTTIVKKKCCKLIDLRIGIFLLGLWAVLVRIAYYMIFLTLFGNSVNIPVSAKYGLACFGLLGGSSGVFAGIFESLLFTRVFFWWAIIHFFGQFVEGIIYAAKGYSWYILFFINFIIWAYFIIIIDRYVQHLKTTQAETHNHALLRNTVSSQGSATYESISTQ